MGDVINISEHRKQEEQDNHDPHISGLAKCLNCEFEAYHSAPVGVTHMECPNCSTMKVVWVYPIGASEGDLVYQCYHCDNEAFTHLIRKGDHRVFCTNCGAEQHLDEMFFD